MKATRFDPGFDESVLSGDRRWQLVQRILNHELLNRADQLRRILEYVSLSAILRPERVVNEYEIACDVLGRPADFDPAQDNIVRSQFSHLRRKLQAYFVQPGLHETLLLTIPRGSYLPVFSELPSPEQAEDAPGFEQTRAMGTPSSEAAEIQGRSSSSLFARRPWSVAVGLVCCSVLLGFGLDGLWRSVSTNSNGGGIPPATPLFKCLAQYEGEVTIVVPDIALVMIENSRGSDNISLSDYLRSDYPQRQLEGLNNPGLRATLLEADARRATSFNEAALVSELRSALAQAGVPSNVISARDLHARDLNQGNSILIGGPSSNPWMSQLVDRNNFKLHEDRQHEKYYFTNAHPNSGELGEYPVQFSWNGSDATGYADVSLTQNPSHTGYVLLVSGSDAPETEMAIRFLLRGNLPPSIAALLSRRDLSGWEVFVRGKHLANEADSSLEVVAWRPMSKN